MDSTVVRDITGRIFEGSVVQRQMDLETEAISRGVDKYRRLAREALERGEGASLKPAERFLVHWFGAVSAGISREQTSVLAGEPGKGRGIYGSVITAIDAERLAVITMHEVLSRTMTTEWTGVLLSRLTYAVGAAVVAECHMDMLKKDHASTIKDLDNRFKRLNTQRINWWAGQTLETSIWNRKVCTTSGPP